jgi:hypothetical protein
MKHKIVLALILSSISIHLPIVSQNNYASQYISSQKINPPHKISSSNPSSYVPEHIDGSKAFIKKIGENRYNVIVINQKTKKVVSALRQIDLKAINNLGKNYGWSI